MVGLGDPVGFFQPWWFYDWWLYDRKFDLHFQETGVWERKRPTFYVYSKYSQFRQLGKKKKSFTSNSRRLIITLDTGSRNSFPPNFKPMSKSMEVNNATYG